MPGTDRPVLETKRNDNESGETTQAVYDHMADIHDAQKTLLSRKHFSVRNQIYLGNVLVFLFALVMVLVLTLNNNQVQKRLKFLEFVNDFSSEIQQARRYEKNYFLYGTNLNDAKENIHLAESIFTTKSEEFSELLGGQFARQEIFSKIGAYKTLLEQLYQRGQKDQNNFHVTPFSKEIELKLRGYGKEILTSAQTMITLEKKTLEKTLSRSRYIHIYSILILLVFLAINTYLLVSRLYSTLNRFAAYAKRIASGDFRPILPQRNFRDEFTDLAIAINEMIKEIDLREAVLIQTHKMKAIGTLTAGVAHEINNPLNNIMLTVHMLLEDYHELSEEEIMEMLKDVAAETDRSKKIIRNLLDFARESTSTMESFDLSILLKDTVHLLENQIRFSGIQVDLQFAENFPKIHGDAQKVQQVFVNLLLNALDASIKGSKIQVIGTLGDTGDSVKVSVIDYGQGIPKHVLPSVFDPFFTTKSKGKGTGLGLSVSQGIIAKHGGTLTVKSEEGRGSCFTITFPIINFPEIHTFSL
ncbi:HAMP domain-containing sensor histidine kinase [Desulfobacula sp.]|uniref:HAMP domain-containing sensor histidine kinase n=1 Tax=Desulfobacula sp. TaxID=2593537 RepID=UPI002620B74D|nr:HAMP domain-containing sensor histidine kinase [Desulfobacula sp.]